jgi:hypothetical protein
VSTRNRAVDEVVPRSWEPDPWRPARKGRAPWLRLLLCPRCGCPLARDAQVTAELPDDPPSLFRTAVRLELVLRDAGADGLPSFGLPRDEMLGRRPRGSTRFELVVPGAGMWMPDPMTGEGRMVRPAPARLMRDSFLAQIRGLSGAARGTEPEPASSTAQRRRQRKRRQAETGLLEFPAAWPSRARQTWHKVQPQVSDGFPGLPGVFFVTEAVRPCAVFCLNPACGGWHRIPVHR